MLSSFKLPEHKRSYMVNSAYWSRKFNKTLNISNAAPLKQVSESYQIYPDPPGILSSVN